MTPKAKKTRPAHVQAMVTAEVKERLEAMRAELDTGLPGAEVSMSQLVAHVITAGIQALEGDLEAEETPNA